MNMKVLKVLLFCAALLANVSQAAEVRLSVFEESTQKTRNYKFNVATSVLKSLRVASGKAVQQTTIYSTKDGYLFFGDKKMVEADELLYQCRVDGYDLVVVRDEYNSFSNPMWMLFAFAGHPVQVSKIVIVKIADRKLRTKTKIIRKAASYHWRVSVLSDRPNERSGVDAGTALCLHSEPQRPGATHRER